MDDISNLQVFVLFFLFHCQKSKTTASIIIKLIKLSTKGEISFVNGAATMDSVR